MDVSCNLTPGPDTVEHIRMAEALGYRRAWLNDSPALYRDVWMTLALAAERTERIGLGVSVVVPSLRHVVVTASAIATLEALAPGRSAVIVGTGFTGRLPARSTTAAVGRRRALRARAARPARRRRGRGRRPARPAAPPRRVDPRPPDRDARARRGQRPEGRRGRPRGRCRDHGHGRAPGRLRLVGVRLRGHRARTGRGPHVRPGSSTRSAPRSRSSTTSRTRWRPPRSTRCPGARSGAG